MLVGIPKSPRAKSMLKTVVKHFGKKALANTAEWVQSKGWVQLWERMNSAQETELATEEQVVWAATKGPSAQAFLFPYIAHCHVPELDRAVVSPCLESDEESSQEGQSITTFSTDTRKTHEDCSTWSSGFIYLHTED